MRRCHGALPVLLALPVLGAGPNGDWVYTKTPGTPSNRADQLESWSEFHTCIEGRSQSPIDIVTADAAPAAEALDGAIVPRLETVPILPWNTGHGFQLHETNPEHFQVIANGTGTTEEPTGLSKGYTLMHGDQYNFYQVHWHTPSENTIDGAHFPLEAHFVHQLNGSTGYTNLAVIAVLYELQEDCSDFLGDFWGYFPLAEEDNDNLASIPDRVVDLQGMLETAVPGGYYHWSGSLTTPPCTEGVTWVLLKTRLGVCQRQVDKLASALSTTQHGVRVNNRMTQPLNQRVVTQTAPEDALLSPYGIAFYSLLGFFWFFLLLLLGVACCRRRSSPNTKLFEAEMGVPELGMAKADGAKAAVRCGPEEEGREHNGHL